MKICVFAYNFQHKKTQEVLVHLFLNKFRVHTTFAANKIKLNFYQSKERVVINNLEFNHPRKISKSINSKYKVIRHDSNKLVKILKKEKFDLGIIAGARILKKKIIEQFKIGILNMHPGLLPLNRGVDSHKWAIFKNWPQGVTCHLIDTKIDLGEYICSKKIKVNQDDSLVDINTRLQNMELNLMIKSLNLIKKNKKFKALNDNRKSQSSISFLKEKIMMKKFKLYKKNYKKIK